MDGFLIIYIVIGVVMLGPSIATRQKKTTHTRGIKHLRNYPGDKTSAQTVDGKQERGTIASVVAYYINNFSLSPDLLADVLSSCPTSCS